MAVARRYWHKGPKQSCMRRPQRIFRAARAGYSTDPRAHNTCPQHMDFDMSCHDVVLGGKWLTGGARF